MSSKFRIKFPTRGFPKKFTPLRGGHSGTQSNTQLCVMEALNWAHNNNLGDARPACVSESFGTRFIHLNDTGTETTRRELFKRVHRLLGTQALPEKELSCWIGAFSKFGHENPKLFPALDKVLDDIDDWCEKHDPQLFALRKAVPSLESITPRRAELLSAINKYSSGKLPLSSCSPLAQKKIAQFESLPGAAPQKEAQ